MEKKEIFNRIEYAVGCVGAFGKLNEPECGLYCQGAVYIFQFLKSEIETGKIA